MGKLDSCGEVYSENTHLIHSYGTSPTPKHVQGLHTVVVPLPTSGIVRPGRIQVSVPSLMRMRWA